MQEETVLACIFKCVIINYKRGNFCYVLLGIRQNIILGHIVKKLQTRERYDQTSIRCKPVPLKITQVFPKYLSLIFCQKISH